MLESLPEKFREFGLHADVRTLLLYRKAVERGMVKTLGDSYNVLKAFVVKEPQMLGPYTRAYYDYFLNIDIQNGESLNDAILRSETFRNWKSEIFERDPALIDLTEEELVNLFLDQVHLTHYDIKKIINGKEIWDKDNPELKDSEQRDSVEQEAKLLDKMADYSGLTGPMCLL